MSVRQVFTVLIGLFLPLVKFEVDDVESPWIFPTKFDFIFCRRMTACILDCPRLALTPDHAVCMWVVKLQEKAQKTGRLLSPGPQLEKFVKDAGFSNVHHEQFRFPLGPWPKDPACKNIGLNNITQFEHGVEGFSLALLVRVLGWSSEEVKAVVAEVKKDTRGPKGNIQFDLLL
ncbi:putative methyltransferase tdiE [Rhypophila decipiens]|uniref:Methyltransferase tdiE n=1 Tax=Rhypophila decipiens TaxID=261697 RepID=A0AAN7B0L7_9PEZI|nr:putative methyltransferase tdiE [Rhypophila decipiens]